MQKNLREEWNSRQLVTTVESGSKTKRRNQTFKEKIENLLKNARNCLEKIQIVSLFWVLTSTCSLSSICLCLLNVSLFGALFDEFEFSKIIFFCEITNVVSNSATVAQPEEAPPNSRILNSARVSSSATKPRILHLPENDKTQVCLCSAHCNWAKKAFKCLDEIRNIRIRGVSPL